MPDGGFAPREPIENSRMTELPPATASHTTSQTLSTQRVLLVQPVVLFGPGGPTRGAFHHGIEIPLALLYLKSFLTQQGYDCRVLDLRIHDHPFDKLRRELAEFHPQVVGTTAFTPEITGAHEVARTAKEFDASITTVVGGLHVSGIPRQTLDKYPHFDFVVYGEGELTLIQLLEALRNGGGYDPINGLAFRNAREVHQTAPRPLVKDLDVFPFPDRSTVLDKKYRPNIVTFNYLRLPTTGIIAGRGCPYDCYHCSKGVWGRTIRFRSAQNIFEEMRQGVEQYGIRDFRFYDDILTMPKGPCKDLCQMILDHGLKISFTCYSRVNYVSEDVLRLMKQAGCFHIKYGIEFGTESSMKRSNRRTTLAQARAAVTMTKKAGIMVKGNFMLGIPSETVEDCQETIAFAKEISPDLVSFAPFYLFPGSRFHREIILEKKSGPEYDLIPTDVLMRLVSRGYREFYLQPAYPFQLLRLAASDPGRLLLTIKVLFKGGLTLLTFFVYRLFRGIKFRQSESEG